jgi:hypothetical protein
VIIPSARRTPAYAALGAAACAWGAAAAWRYHALALTLSHYDARGHLVVARRIFDSITPGWQQIGAVWLPLPHLLNAVPVQIDLFYRTGLSAVAISIASFVVTVLSIASIVEAVTGSLAAGLAGAALFGANPNVLYLQATPMTEPLLLATTTLAVALLIEDCRSVGPQPRLNVEAWRPRTASVGIAFALACLTRYEAWPVTIGALACAVWARWRAGEMFTRALERVARIAAYPAAAVAAFAVFSRVVVGAWFVDDGFFVPENTALGHPIESVKQIVWGVNALSGPWLVGAAAVGLALLFALGLFSARNGRMLVAASVLGTAAVPWLAFLKGHPYRIRYMVPLLAAEAIAASVAAGSLKRFRPIALIVLAGIAVVELRPYDQRAPMIVEAQWDRPNIAGRLPVTSYLAAHYDGTTVMASMGSLGHYMQELSHEGFSVRDFLHEGNGDIWLNALYGPRPYAGWVLIEEKAEGGDMLAVEAREHPAFLAGYSRVADGAGLALYRRNAPPPGSQNLTLNVTR